MRRRSTITDTDLLELETAPGDAPASQASRSTGARRRTAKGVIGALLLAGGGVASAVFLVLMMLEAFVDGDGALSITQALLLATGGAALSGLGLYLASSAILHMRDWVGGAMAVFGAATIPAVTTLVLMTDTEGLETLDVPSVVLLVIGAVGALTAGLRIRRKRLAATVVLIGAALYALTLGGLAALA